MPELAFPERGEVKNITDCECSTDFVERYENDILIAELNNKPSAALANNKESEPCLVVSKLSVKQGRPRTLKPVDEFFLTLCRLRCI